jgi:hypothetical protein
VVGGAVVSAFVFGAGMEHVSELARADAITSAPRSTITCAGCARATAEPL